MKFTVIRHKKDGDNYERYFKTWKEVVRYMKWARRLKKGAEKFEIYFNNEGEIR